MSAMFCWCTVKLNVEDVQYYIALDIKMHLKS